MRKAIAILLVVLFLATMTVTAVSALCGACGSPAQVAAFTTSVSGNTVKFTDKSTASPTSYLWRFGDGTFSTLKNPVHKYSKAGTYTVTLTVKNSAGSNTVMKGKYITVYK